MSEMLSVTSGTKQKHIEVLMKLEAVYWIILKVQSRKPETKTLIRKLKTKILIRKPKLKTLPRKPKTKTLLRKPTTKILISYFIPTIAVGSKRINICSAYIFISAKP
uniref:Uncharacterized protein n=1 Tax=Cacopsylla melanoneura TaxID=428564 RepID=A0A8D8XD17_9HEMI